MIILKACCKLCADCNLHLDAAFTGMGVCIGIVIGISSGIGIGARTCQTGDTSFRLWRKTCHKVVAPIYMRNTGALSCWI